MKKKKLTHKEKHEREGYISEFVYGGIDGSVTTFAVVTGATGALLSPSVILILGFANLFADGFSMAVSNYLSRKSEIELVQKFKKQEEWEIENKPKEETREVKEIYRKKGFSGIVLEKIVKKITSDKKIWVNTMLKDELNIAESERPPIKTALATYFSFIVIGFIPLLSYVAALFNSKILAYQFPLSILLTASAFGFIGTVKGKLVKGSPIRGAIETIFVGSIAAAIAFFIGMFIRYVLLA